MAAAKTKTVTVRLPISRTEKEPVFVGLNGKTYLIQRGIPVAVPVGVAKILQRQERALMEAYAFASELEARTSAMEEANII